ncbi:hypothetical protein ACFL3S_12480, partial [Gemmatimonadota bacterium]
SSSVSAEVASVGEGDRERGSWLSILDALSPLDVEALSHHLLEWGELVEGQGHFWGAREIQSLAYELAVAAGSAVIGADAARFQGRVCRKLAEWNDAFAWYGVAQGLAEETQDVRTLSRVLDGLANTYRDRGNLPRAREVLEEVLALGRREAIRYQAGNWARARRFLDDPTGISLIATLPPGSLSERGAWWLFLRYLYGLAGQEGLLSRLTHTTLSGVSNVTGVMRRHWDDLVSDWAGALYFDGLSVPVRPGLRFWGINLRDVLARADGRYPLRPPSMGPGSFAVQGSLWSSAPDYYIIVPPAAGGLALNLAGPEGRPQDPAAGLRLLVVRLN